MMEHGVGIESFLTYARSYVQKNRNFYTHLNDDYTSWNDLHSHLAKAGMGIKPYGQGLVIFDLNLPNLFIKASSVYQGLSIRKLEAILGSYQISAPQLSAEHNHYDPKKVKPRDESQRAIQKAKRQELRQDLLRRYREERNSFFKAHPMSQKGNDEYIQINEWSKQAKAEIKATVSDYNRRMMLYGVVAFERQKRIHAIKYQKRHEKKQSLQKVQNNFPNYHAWVLNKAEQGDKAALSQKRGWEYAQKRSEKRNSTLNYNLANRPKI